MNSNEGEFPSVKKQNEILSRFYNSFFNHFYVKKSIFLHLPIKLDFLELFKLFYQFVNFFNFIKSAHDQLLLEQVQ